MARKESARNPDPGREIGAERVERERFEDARRQGRIISGVRTKIDKSK